MEGEWERQALEIGHIRNNRTDVESNGEKNPVKSFYILQVKKLKQLMSKERTEVHIINVISPQTYPLQQIYSKYFSLMHT